MRLFKWLFQPAYLLLIIVVMALYVNREAVFPEEVAESLEAEALVARVEGLVERLRSDLQEPVVIDGEDQTVAVESASVDASALSAEEPKPTELDTIEPMDVVAVQIDEIAADQGVDEITDDATTSVKTPESEVVAITDLVAETEQTVVEAEVTDIASTPETSPSLPVADTSVLSQQPAAEAAVSPLTYWKAARAAVWQGDLASAVVSYQMLITAQPDNYDAYGEMGNVLLAQSNAPAAADAYATAATLIYRSGNREMAYRVANIVMTLDRDRALALQGEFAR